VSFPTPGFYPFLCPEHVDQGMLGVVWVTAP
jgi:plastocyanin